MSSHQPKKNRDPRKNYPVQQDSDFLKIAAAIKRKIERTNEADISAMLILFRPKEIEGHLRIQGDPTDLNEIGSIINENLRHLERYVDLHPEMEPTTVGKNRIYTFNIESSKPRE